MKTNKKPIDLRPASSTPQGFSTLRPEMIAYNVHRLNAKEVDYMNREQDDEEVRRIELAVYHMLLANELALQQVLVCLEQLRKTPYYRNRIKQQARAVERQVVSYRNTINRHIRAGGGDGFGRLVTFSDMNDNLEEVCGPHIERTRYAIRLSLGRVGVKEDALMAVAIMAMKTCQAAVAVQESEYRINQQVAGGIIHHALWVTLRPITHSVYDLCCLLSRETVTNIPPDYNPMNEQSIVQGIIALCKNLGNTKVVAAAIQKAQEDNDVTL